MFSYVFFAACGLRLFDGLIVLSMSLYTEEINKTALTREDDKRVVIEDGIHTKHTGIIHFANNFGINLYRNI